MPFSWFGSSSTVTSSAEHSLSERHHTRKVSLSSSSSGSARLAGVRAKVNITIRLRWYKNMMYCIVYALISIDIVYAHFIWLLLIHQTKTSYLQKQMTTGDLSSSRGRRSSHNPNNNPSQRKQVIVAVEADDDSRHMRIDQGLIDASYESKNQVLVQQQTPNNNKSSAWWPSVLSATPSTTTTTTTTTNNAQLPSQVAQMNINLNNPVIPLASESEAKANDTVVHTHRRTVSKTFRVP